MNMLEKVKQNQLDALAQKRIDAFEPGDTVKVNVRIVEGANERIQAFEGVCIGKKDRGLDSAFTVRKLSHGEGVERVFPLYSPLVDSVEVVRRGEVRRAKLYYLRGRTGKAARIREKMDFTSNEAAKEAKAERKAAKAAKAEKKPAAKKAKAKKDDA